MNIAKATVLSFEDYEVLPGDYPRHYLESGYWVNGGLQIGDDSIFCDPDCARNGSTYLWGSLFTMSFDPSNPRIFDLLSFDATELNVGDTVTLEVSGRKHSGETVFYSITLDGINDGLGPAADFQRVELPISFTSLDYVEVKNTTSFPYFAFDNIELVNEQAIGEGETSGVPEPGIGILIMTGWGLVYLRRRSFA